MSPLESFCAETEPGFQGNRIRSLGLESLLLEGGLCLCRHKKLEQHSLTGAFRASPPYL